MKKLILFFSLFALFLPIIAKTAGLVPCGGPNEKPCTACDLLVLADNILHFALTTAFLIVVIFAIVGGFRWILSGGNEENIKAGQQTITSALIGLIIILSAWLIINTIFWLIAVIGGEDYTGTWWHLECTEQLINNSGNGNVGGNGGGNGKGGNNGEANIYQYGDACRMQTVPPYDCHKEENCCYSNDDCDFWGKNKGQVDCPDGWVCCVAKRGATDPPLPTPPTTENTGCPNNSPKISGTCYKYVCKHSCSNPNGPLQCLAEKYYTEPMCPNELKNYICPGHENDECDWKNPNSCKE